MYRQSPAKLRVNWTQWNLTIGTEPANVLPEGEDIPFLSDEEAPSQEILHVESIDPTLFDNNDNAPIISLGHTHSWKNHGHVSSRILKFNKKQTNASRSTMDNVQEDDNEDIILSSD